MHLGCIYTSLFRSSSVQKFRKIVLVKDIIDHPLMFQEYGLLIIK